MKILPKILLRSVMTLMLAALVGCAPAIKPTPAKNPEFSLYSFDKYGLSIEVPQAWKVKTRGKSSGAAAFLGGGPRGFVRNKYGPHKFILSAHENPYRGPSEQRSYVTCTVTNAGGASAKTVLEGTRQLYSLYPGGTPQGVRITQIEPQGVGGKSGYYYKITLDPPGKGPSATLELVSVKHRDAVFMCQGLYTHTQPNKTKVQYALRSIKLD